MHFSESLMNVTVRSAISFAIMIATATIDTATLAIADIVI